MSSEGMDTSYFFFCHQCRANFSLSALPTDDSSAVCPSCLGGFIEERPEQTTTPGDHQFGQTQIQSPQDLIDTINVLSGRPSGVGGGPQDGTAGGGGAPMAFIGFPNFMQELTDIFASFDGGRGGQQIHLIQPNPGMTMHSNPGDYVFGGAGIDTIVTQIFNQPLDGVGPPPLDKELIKKIPTVNISREQVGEENQGHCYCY
uniref:RING-type E3 ubiquitin transferase n=1 Tax=Caligus clemensi TaxID=344056 RepID=C1C028_CALCM|nr:Zinc finger protein 364 [Caligus clemensi]